MNDRETKMTRGELYDLVWSVPITRLSKKYGLSDVGFAKICKKHNIPRPPRGYWARVESGQKLKKTPLPPGNKDLIIELPQKRNTEIKEKIQSEAQKTKKFTAPIMIPESLRGANPIVKQTNDILKSIEPDHLGILNPPKNDCLDISVSKKSLRRSLIIMDGLIKTLEGNGYDFFLSDECTQVRLLDVTLKIKMSEEITTVQKEPKKHDLDGYYNFGHSRFDTERVPSGKLCLTIDEHFWRWNENYRKNWRDTGKKTLEEQLHGFANGLVAAAVRKKACLQEKEERQRKEREIELQRQERMRIRAEKIEQKKNEQQKVSKLLADAGNWEKSLLLRKFIAEVERQAEEGEISSIQDGNLKEWICWAYQQADRLDPFSGNTHSILDEEIEEEIKPERPYLSRW